jgi:hypothetical protein
MKKPKPQVTFTFRNKAERDYFMGQLSDGWGENKVELKWPWRKGVEFEDCTEFGIELAPDELDELKRHQELDRKMAERLKQ